MLLPITTKYGKYWSKLHENHHLFHGINNDSHPDSASNTD